MELVWDAHILYTLFFSEDKVLLKMRPFAAALS